MSAINGFIVSVVGIIFVTTAFSYIMPEGTIAKYINFVLGAVVVITILGSVMKIDKIDFESVLTANASAQSVTDDMQNRYDDTVIRTFELNMQENIVNFIFEKYARTSDCKVRCSITDGNVVITAVHINAEGSFNTAAAKNEIASQYGIDAGIISFSED